MDSYRGSSCRRLVAVFAATAAGACLFAAPAALAQPPGCPFGSLSTTACAPAWTITSVSQPTNFAPGDSTGDDSYAVTAIDSGGAPTSGPITLTDTLPSGLTLAGSGLSGQDDVGNTVNCSAGPPITCTDSNSTPLQPGQAVVILVPVTVSPTAPASVTNSATVTGAGAPAVATSEPTTISATPASFRVTSFDSTAANPDGSTATQAGSHPYEMTTSFKVTTALNSRGEVLPTGSIKNVNVALPPGLIGDPSATPRCTQGQLAQPGFSAPACPADSQVGVVTTTGPASAQSTGRNTWPVFNMVPPPGMPAQFGFKVAIPAVYINIAIRTGGDYGVTATVANTAQILPLTGTSLTLWGVPGDPSHDAARCLFPQGGCSPTVPFQAQVEPLLTMPTACSGPLTTNVSLDSWQDPASFLSAGAVSEDSQGNPVGLGGCDHLDFSPTISAQPETTAADSPSGLSVDVHVPQDGLTSPTGLAEADLKTAVVTLPPGTAVSPSAADGLGACSPGQIGLGNATEPSCPDASKIGTVEVDTPLLPDPLKGSVFVAQQNNNPFNSLLAIYVTAEADGVLVKLAGHVVADPVTGQLQTTFDNNPQLPFSDFKLNFSGGPRAALATPESCGTFTTTSSLTPWSGGPAATPSDVFTIGSGCVTGFAPSFSAGVSGAQAGSFSPFVLSFSRSDTDQALSALSVTLPPGMLAKLAGVQECSDAELATAAASSGTAEQANPSCPTGSQVGTVETGAGPGSNPFFLSGKVYLTGPYKGAPYGLAVVVPALAGPYDLGTVVVRQALYIDPTTARVTDVSDPFPTILQGIPLRLRRIDVTLDRPDFTVNPTSCDPMAITGALTSTGGTTAAISSRFQVGGCSALAFSPRLKMTLTGKGKTRSGDHPTLTATLSQPLGQANIHSARVTLPLSLALDPNNSQHVCNYDVAQAVHGGAVGCPASTIVGTATADTPLLSQPLTGDVYLVQGIRFNKQGQRIRTLPSLLIPLRGQIALDLRAQSSVNGASQLVTTFSTIPDAPVSKFTLQITGGPKGLLVITGRGQTICNKAQLAGANLGAQSGKTEGLSIKMATPCGRLASLRGASVKGLQPARHGPHPRRRQAGRHRTVAPRANPHAG